MSGSPISKNVPKVLARDMIKQKSDITDQLFSLRDENLQLKKRLTGNDDRTKQFSKLIKTFGQNTAFVQTAIRTLQEAFKRT
jgi:hypothetical protein